MKKIILTSFASSLLVGIGSAAIITYDFDDAAKITDGLYGTANDSYSGADLNEFVGVTASAFALDDGTRNQGTIGVPGTTATGVGSAGISATGSDAATNFAQSMSFSLNIADGANVDFKAISFTHGYFNNATRGATTTDITWNLRVTEGANTYSYSSVAWTHDGTTNYQLNPNSPSALALDAGLSGLSDTIVNFTWTFSGQRGHNLNVQSNWLDDITISSVPEPSSYALLAGCLGLVSVMLRRRR